MEISMSQNDKHAVKFWYPWRILVAFSIYLLFFHLESWRLSARQSWVVLGLSTCVVWTALGFAPIVAIVDALELYKEKSRLLPRQILLRLTWVVLLLTPISAMLILD